MGKNYSYKILKSKPRLYHKKFIAAGFDFMEKYHKFLLKCCRESPSLTLTADEVFSDLVIDRVPRWMENCSINIDEIQKVVSTDLRPLKNPNLLHFNVHHIENTLEAHTAGLNDLAKNDPNYIKKADEHLKQMKVCAAQMEKLYSLQGLAKSEKRLKAYFRSCIRRTKLKYLQKTEFEKRHNLRTELADPTNGMLELVDYRNVEEGSSVKEFDKVLQGTRLDVEARWIITEVLEMDKSFVEVSETLGVSRTTAARKYQAAVKILMKELNSRKMIRELLTK